MEQSQLDKIHKDVNTLNICDLTGDTNAATPCAWLFYLGLIILLSSIISLLVCKFRK